MPAEKTAANTAPPAPKTATTTEVPAAATAPALAIGDTLTVVSGRISGAWIVEDDSGTVYRATPAE